MITPAADQAATEAITIDPSEIRARAKSLLAPPEAGCLARTDLNMGAKGVLSSENLAILAGVLMKGIITAALKHLKPPTLIAFASGPVFPVKV